MSIPKRYFSPRWLGVIFPVVFLLLLGASLSIYNLAYATRIFPGVAMGQISLAGLTASQAESKLSSVWNDYSQAGIVVKSDKYQVTVPAVLNSTNSDLAVNLMYVYLAQAATAAYQVGHSGVWYNDLVEPVLIRLWPTFGQIKLPVDIDINRLVKYISSSLPELGAKSIPARLRLNTNDKLEIIPETIGREIDAVDLGIKLQAKIETMSAGAIELTLKSEPAAVTAQELTVLLPAAQAALKPVKLIFTFADATWAAQPSVWQAWLQPVLNPDQLAIRLSSEAATGFFSAIGQTVNQPAQDAKFEIKDGRVELFQASQEGREVDISATLAQINEKLAAIDNNITWPLVVKSTQPNVTTAEVNNLGVTEIIGTGKSNFAGSPPNRRHNIKVGADKLNGVIIQPDEEFSLVKTLGAIDAASGYLQELVIKGNKTIPEYGGGLCQIGTTTFRAALSSGLPILERRSHSYRVPYYEPAGTDATIYDPSPDFKFKNDTGRAILIQTKIKGDELIFEFWGAKDGRQAEQTKPRIYNIVKPPPTKIIETTELPVGQKKCTEKAHTGADAEFNYKVTYPNGEVKDQTFRSHYVPWQEVCLLGVAKLDSSEQNSTSDSSAATPSASSDLPAADVSGQTGN